jgi:hypothetical protein
VEKSDEADTNCVMSRYCRPTVRATPSMFVYGSVCEMLYTFEKRPPAASSATRSPSP